MNGDDDALSRKVIPVGDRIEDRLPGDLPAESRNLELGESPRLDGSQGSCRRKRVLDAVELQKQRPAEVGPLVVAGGADIPQDRDLVLGDETSDCALLPEQEQSRLAQFGVIGKAQSFKKR